MDFTTKHFCEIDVLKKTNPTIPIFSVVLRAWGLRPRHQAWRCTVHHWWHYILLVGLHSLRIEAETASLEMYATDDITNIVGLGLPAWWLRRRQPAWRSTPLMTKNNLGPSQTLTDNGTMIHLVYRIFKNLSGSPRALRSNLVYSEALKHLYTSREPTGSLGTL